MRAIIVPEWLESPSQLSIKEVPDLHPKDNQVIVRVKAIGANFFDILMVQGKYQIKPPRPFTPGSEFAGDVLSVGKDVSKVRPGDRVFGSCRWGAYAEQVCATEDHIYKIPKKLSYDQAAGLFVTYPTSYAGLIHRANLKRGETLLVHAAAGGVGIPAIQIAKHLGATVIATASSREKLDLAKANGADHTVNYREKDWADQVLKLTKDRRGVDVVFDPVGLIGPSLRCIAWSGRLVVVGFAGGTIESLPLNRVLLKNISVIGLHWGEYEKHEPNTVDQVWSHLLRLLDQGHLNPLVYPTIYRGLDQAKEALRALGSRETYGKVIVHPSTSSSDHHL
ncbi:MAG: hypothetical protein DHS80DRAFT_19161 [Piptocephalis tieghemiana]|nr:MAG: hypothetical protein DHS80DRAFT_19161 [Piptocephalis tieghemiana]